MKNKTIRTGLETIKMNPNFICHHSITDFGGEIHVMHVMGISYMKLYWHNEDEKELIMSDFDVSISQRENGIGTCMLKMFNLVGEALGCNKIILAVESDSWMKKWYIRDGFCDSAIDHEDIGKVWLCKNLTNE